MPEIKSMKDLQNALLPAMKDMTDKLADHVYKTLNYFLQSNNMRVIQKKIFILKILRQTQVQERYRLTGNVN